MRELPVDQTGTKAEKQNATGIVPVTIPSVLLDAMIRHAQAEAPLECCGFLTGRGGRIDSIVPAVNQLRSRTAFSVAPTELFDFFRGLRRSGKELLGIYHSHPHSRPVPSVRDIEEFHYPGVSYWIVSPAGDDAEVRCYRLRGTAFEQIPFTRG